MCRRSSRRCAVMPCAPAASAASAAPPGRVRLWPQPAITRLAQRGDVVNVDAEFEHEIISRARVPAPAAPSASDADASDFSDAAAVSNCNGENSALPASCPARAAPPPLKHRGHLAREGHFRRTGLENFRDRVAELGRNFLNPFLRRRVAAQLPVRGQNQSELAQVNACVRRSAVISQ